MAQTTDTELENARAELDSAFEGQFMEPQVVLGDWHNLDGATGIQSYPAEYFTLDDAIESYTAIENHKPWESGTVIGYGARLSAPGYLDCTEWTVFDTELEAIEYLIETYAD